LVLVAWKNIAPDWRGRLGGRSLFTLTHLWALENHIPRCKQVCCQAHIVNQLFRKYFQK
jgi:hypothetical protein